MPSKSFCSFLLEDANGKILLQLRDDKPTIRCPNLWGTFGGHLEEGETPLQGVIREIKEELDYDLEDPEYLGIYPHEDGDVHFYRKKDPNVTIEQLHVMEGQKGQFFTLEEIKDLPTAFNAKEAILAIYKENE